MQDILRNATYARLFAAQVVALVGTGLATVALALLAYDLAGADAGSVLGTALFIKMVAYVGIAPFAGAIAVMLPRKVTLVGMDVVRAGVALLLPFVDAIWQIYVLIFLLQASSAVFTPVFQATIPDVLPDERDYTRALSLSRLAYDLESLLSPALAAALLVVVSFHALFGGTAIGFALSAALVLAATIPAAHASSQRSFGERVSKGIGIYLATPRLRGLLALNLSVAAAGAMVIVNSVVVARSLLGRSESELGLLMAAFGGGSMLAALTLPRLLDRLGDRPIMLPAAATLAVLLLVTAAFVDLLDGGAAWVLVLVMWLAMGVCTSSILTPTGRLLRRSASAEDRPLVFAAQFALSHACWLVTYPLAGWLGTAAGIPAILTVLAVVTLAGALVAVRVWPKDDPVVVAHEHPELPAGHRHLREGVDAEGRHAHVFVIDDLHPTWPQKGL